MTDKKPPDKKGTENYQICSNCWNAFEVKETEAIKHNEHYFCSQTCHFEYVLWRPSTDAELA